MGLIGTIAGESLSPLNESVKDFFSPPLNTTIISAVVFDPISQNNKKIVQSGAETASPSITFEFGAFNGKLGDNSSSFECSFDGAPFEPCLSPKPYGELASELTHIFQVRAKGILGNVDKTPDKFTITTVTSTLVEGVFKNRDNIVPNTPVSIISSDGNRTTSTDDRGGFFFDDVKWGNHFLQVYLDNSKFPHYIVFPIQQGTHWKDLGVISVDNLSRISTTANVNLLKVSERSKVNPEFKPEPQIKAPINYSVGLLQQAKKVNNNAYLAKISLQAINETLSKINNVTYYLHPTFDPSVITTKSPQDRFAISFTGWGFFNLKAKVYFKDGHIQDLSLPIAKWKPL